MVVCLHEEINVRISLNKQNYRGSGNKLGPDVDVYMQIKSARHNYNKAFNSI